MGQLSGVVLCVGSFKCSTDGVSYGKRHTFTERNGDAEAEFQRHANCEANVACTNTNSCAHPIPFERKVSIDHAQHTRWS